MSYTALYRKWRPTLFQDVKGQDHIVQTLKNQISADRIGHAYLFCGTRGTGKTSIAKIFARAVNCEHPKEGSPCNACDICKSIALGSSMNVVEIDAASNNGVENIREIREQVQYPPTEGTYRVYIIDEVHMLSTGAFNALLKTLEEPPAYVIFILATTEVNKIPITVLSRCQRYDFKRITTDTLVARLKELTAQEGIPAEDRALAYIAKAADGSMRDALSLLDQCVAFHYGTLLTYDNVLEVLGAVDSSVFSQLLRAVIAGQTAECIRKLEELVIQGRELGQFVTDFIWYLRNLLLLKTTDDGERMLEMSEDNLKQLREEAEMIDGDRLMRYIRVFSELSSQMRYASQKRILIEMALIRLTRPQMEYNLDSVIQRLNELEERLEEKNEGFSPEFLGQLAVKPEVSVSEELRQVAIPKAQMEDLELIRKDWGKIVRELGGSIRPSFRDTIVEPGGEGCLCVVFSSEESYSIGSRATVLGALEAYVREHYNKELHFKVRKRESGEPLNTIYISDEELKNAIHIDIVVEE
ncbi:MAG: DNA polymerase III subunit gamma/tau [Lachnospiraceae bacterium]|jgi:DNA polymerase-3 subunit gamma/tau|nr:DNA polymerase III subunit gamma/tau [Lachnospiraceae bacterium]